jgi:hypothetical protein
MKESSPENMNESATRDTVGGNPAFAKLRHGRRGKATNGLVEQERDPPAPRLRRIRTGCGEMKAKGLLEKIRAIRSVDVDEVRQNLLILPEIHQSSAGYPIYPRRLLEAISELCLAYLAALREHPEAATRRSLQARIPAALPKSMHERWLAAASARRLRIDGSVDSLLGFVAGQRAINNHASPSRAVGRCGKGTARLSTEDISCGVSRVNRPASHRDSSEQEIKTAKADLERFYRQVRRRRTARSSRQANRSKAGGKE